MQCMQHCICIIFFRAQASQAQDQKGCGAVVVGTAYVPLLRRRLTVPSLGSFITKSRINYDGVKAKSDQPSESPKTEGASKTGEGFAGFPVRPGTAKALPTFEDSMHATRTHYCHYPRAIVEAGPCRTALDPLAPLVSHNVGRINGVSIRIVLNHTAIICNNP